MVELTRDRKARHMWLITTTDSEGFHRQLPISHDDMRELPPYLLFHAILHQMLNLPFFYP